MIELRIIFCGDRWWTDRESIAEVMHTLIDAFATFTVIEGEARGADLIAKAIARSYDLPVASFKADWDRFKKAAGPIRNAEMLYHGRADGVVAFHKNIMTSSGTKNMVMQARKAGVPAWVWGDSIEWFIREVKERMECQQR